GKVAGSAAERSPARHVASYREAERWTLRLRQRKRGRPLRPDGQKVRKIPRAGEDRSSRDRPVGRRLRQLRAGPLPDDAMKNVNRRTFVSGVVALATTSVLGCKSASKTQENPTTAPAPPARVEEGIGLSPEEANAPAMSDGRPALRVVLKEADGSPLDPERMRTLTARDMNNDPLPQPIVTGPGRARIELNREDPIQLCMRLKVPGFGEVYCYADNDGRGYTQPGTMNFAADAAETRFRRVADAYESLRPSGLVLPREFHELFSSAAPKGARMDPTTYGYRRLEPGLHAGEIPALDAARQRIARFATPRRDFKFGVMVQANSFAGDEAVEYEKRVRELFNFATANWYTWRAENFADADPVDYARMDQSIDWCLARNIQPKTFGYLYMSRGATPEWIRPIEVPAKRQATTEPTQINTMPNSEPSNE